MRQKQHGRAYIFEWGAIQKFQKLKVSQNLGKYEVYSISYSTDIRN